jgi:hypothetical protein
MDLREIGLGVWIGFDWLRIGTGGGLLWNNVLQQNTIPCIHGVLCSCNSIQHGKINVYMLTLCSFCN